MRSTGGRQSYAPVLKRAIAGACATLHIVGCTAYQPVVDPITIPDQARYAEDLEECRILADTHKRTEEEVTSAAVGTAVAAGGTTIVAAVVGAAISAGTVIVAAAAWPFIAGAAVVGGVVWGARERSRTKQERATLIENCLRGRGYQPLERQ